MKSLSLLVVILTVILTSCKDDIITPNNLNYAHTATSNNLIAVEYSGQTSEKNSNIYFVTDNGNNGVYFYGLKNGNYVLGSMELNGNTNWTRTVNFGVRDLTTYEINGIKYLFAVGGRDSDGDNFYDEGHFIIYDDSGEQLDEKLIVFDEFTSWFSTVELEVNTNEVVGRAAGGARKGGTYYPFLLDFSVDLGNNSIAIDLDDDQYYKLFDNLSNYTFRDMKGTKNSVFSYTIVDEVANQGKGFGLMRLNNLQLVWNKELSADTAKNGFAGINEDLQFENGIIYFTSIKKIIKEEGNEDYTKKDWQVTKVYALNESSGSIIWEKTIDKTSRSDRFDQLIIENNNLYLVGGVANWADNSPTPALNFGYGSIVVLDKNSGMEKSFHSFGIDTQQQEFNCIYSTNSDLYLMGYTNYSSSSYDKWIVKVRKNDL